MKIQVGEVQMKKIDKQEILPNRTRKYLLPCLQEYGANFMGKLNNVFKVAAGVGDIIIENNGKGTYEKHVFILLRSDIAPMYFNHFINWIRNQPMYEEDYVFGNIQKSNFHMVIIRLPEKFYDSFTSFKKGEYSKMFSKQTIDAFFSKHPNIQKILIKDKEYKVVFTNRVNRMFGSNIKPEDWQPDEYDFPPQAEHEIFNNHLKKK